MLPFLVLRSQKPEQGFPLDDHVAALGRRHLTRRKGFPERGDQNAVDGTDRSNEGVLKQIGVLYFALESCCFLQRHQAQVWHQPHRANTKTPYQVEELGIFLLPCLQADLLRPGMQFLGGMRRPVWVYHLGETACSGGRQ